MWIITEDKIINMNLVTDVRVVTSIEGVETVFDFINEYVKIKGDHLDKITNFVTTGNKKYLDLR